MPTKYKQSANDAKARLTTAKESSDRHSHDAAQMQEHANEATDRFHKAQKRQRKREADKNPR